MADRFDEFRYPPGMRVVGIVHGIAAIEDPRINVRLRVCLRCEDPLEMGGTAPLEPPHEQTKARIGVCRRCRILYVLTE